MGLKSKPSEKPIKGNNDIYWGQWKIDNHDIELILATSERKSGGDELFTTKEPQPHSLGLLCSDLGWDLEWALEDYLSKATEPEKLAQDLMPNVEEWLYLGDRYFQTIPSYPVHTITAEGVGFELQPDEQNIRVYAEGVQVTFPLSELFFICFAIHHSTEVSHKDRQALKLKIDDNTQTTKVIQESMSPLWGFSEDGFTYQNYRNSKMLHIPANLFRQARDEMILPLRGRERIELWNTTQRKTRLWLKDNLI